MGQRISILPLLSSASDAQIENLLNNKEASAVDLKAIDAGSRNALHIAASLGRANVVSQFLNHHIFEIDDKDVHGFTALHIAVFNNHYDTASVLISNGADVNLQDMHGMTPLHWAVSEHNLECTELLVSNGALLDVVNAKVQTVHDLASKLKKRFREPILAALSNTRQTITTSSLKMQRSATGALLSQSDEMSALEIQIAGLCTLWGLIKYTHPYLGYRNDINWDKALLDSFRSLLENNSNGSEPSENRYFVIVDRMLYHLKDPNTFIDYKPHVPSKEVRMEKKAPEIPRRQPYVEVVENVAIVVITDYSQFNKNSKVEILRNTLTSAVDVASALVVDVRCLHIDDPSTLSSNSLFLSYIFEEAFRMFLVEDLILPTKRQSVWNGYPEHRRNNTNRVFFHGMMMADSDTISCSAETQPPHKIFQKPITFIANKNTPQSIIHFVSSLQASARHDCSIVYHTEPYKVRRVEEEGGMLLFEPGVMTSIFDLCQSKVYVRLNEIVNSDNTVGFHPDLILVKGEELKHLSLPIPPPKALVDLFPDPVIHIATQLTLKTLSPPPSCTVVVRQANLFAKRQLDSSYPEVPSNPPPTEYRLLGLSRLWNAIQYFYPYKNRITRPLKDLLSSSILSFINAASDLQYATAVAEVIHEIHDSLSYVNSNALVEHLGTYVPPLSVKMVEGRVVVTRVFHEIVVFDVDIKAGDIVVEVDGEDIIDKFERISSLLSSSAEPENDFRIFPFLLAGKQNSVATLRIKRIVGREEDGVTLTYEDKQIEMYRVVTPHKYVTTVSPYILDQVDRTGKNIGYIDLRVISVQQVPEAMKQVKSTNSLIIDLRGFTKGAGYKLARYLTKKKVTSFMSIVPFFVPSLLVDGTEPSMNVSSQYCSPIYSSPEDQYNGKIVALVDNTTVSTSELSCFILLAARPDIVVIGTKTTLALGTATNLVLPGNVEVGFVGMGYLPPDDLKLRQHHHHNNYPTPPPVPDPPSPSPPSLPPPPPPHHRHYHRHDITVEEKISDIIEGKDQILERAIIYLQTEQQE